MEEPSLVLCFPRTQVSNTSVFRLPDFLFIVCSHPEICVILRVVDTCTGCVPEDHQFDLTRRAFVMLFNDADKGEGDVLYRQFPEPPSDNWFDNYTISCLCLMWISSRYEELWGPRVSN